MRRFVFAVLHILDFIEAIPYNIRWGLEFAWWLVSLPFAVAEIHMKYWFLARRRMMEDK